MSYVQTWGGSLKDLHLGDDKINARGEKGGKFVVPHPPFLQHSLSNSIDLVFVTTTKKRPWESVRGMMRWRNEGGEGSGAGSGGAGASWRFLCPSWSPLFLWSHAASCTIPQLWVTGPWVKARQQGQILQRSGLCLFSACFLQFILKTLCVLLWFYSPDHD